MSEDRREGESRESGAPRPRNRTMPSESARHAMRHALRRRCPACGEGRPFRAWLRMKTRCEVCGLKFEREPGYFVGALYFNYLPIAVALIVLFFALAEGVGWGLEVQWPFLLALAILLPLIWFPYSRLLWMAFDFRISPLTEGDFEDARE